MRTFKASGIVLREYEAGEADKRLVLLCKEYGKMMAYARGARKPKSKLLSSAQLFTYSDFILNDGGTFLSVGQAQPVRRFFGVTHDYERLCCAHYITEICEKAVMENTPCDDLLRLLLTALTRLSEPEKSGAVITPRQVAGVFLLHFLIGYGLAPETTACCICGNAISPDEGQIGADTHRHENAADGARRHKPLDFGAGFCDEGILCARCLPLKPHKTMLSPPALAALRYITASGMSEAFRFRASESVLQTLLRAGQLCWAGHFQIKLQSEDWLHGDKTL